MQYTANINPSLLNTTRQKRDSMMDTDMIINQVIMFYLVTLAIVIHGLFISDIF